MYAVPCTVGTSLAGLFKQEKPFQIEETMHILPVFRTHTTFQYLNQLGPERYKGFIIHMIATAPVVEYKICGSLWPCVTMSSKLLT